MEIYLEENLRKDGWVAIIVLDRLQQVGPGYYPSQLTVLLDQDRPIMVKQVYRDIGQRIGGYHREAVQHHLAHLHALWILVASEQIHDHAVAQAPDAFAF